MLWRWPHMNCSEDAVRESGSYSRQQSGTGDVAQTVSTRICPASSRSAQKECNSGRHRNYPAVRRIRNSEKVRGGAGARRGSSGYSSNRTEDGVPDGSFAWETPQCVGCCVETSWANRAIARSLTEQRVRAVPVRVEDLLRQSRDARVEGLVYDLAPWTTMAWHGFRYLTDGRPELPVLLYLPPTGSAFAVLGELPNTDRVRIQVQGRDAQSLQSLKSSVSWLITSSPRLEVMALIRLTVSKLPSTAYLFAHQVLIMLGAGCRPSVFSVARTLGVCSRTVERRLAHAHMPPPKRLLDWITLLYIGAVAVSTHKSICQSATSVGLSSNDIYRIRRRLLGSWNGRPLGIRAFWSELLGAFALEVNGSRSLGSRS